MIQFDLTNKIFDFIKTVNMPDKEIDLEAFWSSLLSFRDKNTPNPNWVTEYHVKKHYKMTPQAVKKAVGDKTVRYNPETGEVAEEDIIMVKMLTDYFDSLKKSDVIKEADIFGNKKYLVVDMYKHKQSLTKYQIETLNKIVTGFTADVYDLIPKNLTLEEKIELLKKQSS